MRLIEYRIFMPMTVEENLIGQLWSFAEFSRENTGGGEGVEILENELFDVPLDANGNVVRHRLPNYCETTPDGCSNGENEDDSQQTGGSQTFSNGNCNEQNGGGVSGAASRILRNPFRKSSSKESFKGKKQPSNGGATVANGIAGNSGEKGAQSERSRSLDRQNSSSSFASQLPEQTAASTTNVTSPSSVALELPKPNGTPTTGQYTHKIYMIASKLPWFVRKLLPRESTILHERSWNMYPVVKTVLTNEFFKNQFRIELDTITREVPASGQPEENVHNLSAEQLEKREVVLVDIAEPVAPSDYKEDEDPTLVRSAKTGRGPLTAGWINSGTRPLICCYKLASIEFRVFGLQTRSETYMKYMYKQLFTLFHRQIFCWMDKWHGITLEDVRKIEADLAKLLVKKIVEGEQSQRKLIDE